MLLLTAAAAIFLVITADGKAVTDETGRCPPPECRGRRLEISFVMDNSATIWSVNYTQGLWFMENFVDKFNIGPDEVRVSVVTYGDRVYVDDAIDFDDYTDKKVLKEAIKKLPYKGGNSTQTGAAIRYVLDKQLPQAREGVRKVIVVLTDGDSHQPEITRAEAKRALDAGLEVFAIGVGLKISTAELHNIASDDKHVFPVGTYNVLNDVMDKLLYQACGVKPHPPCRHDFVDIAFVIDSSGSVNEENFSLGKEFIKEFLTGFTINPTSARVAAVMYGDRVYSESAIPFDKYKNEKETYDAISDLEFMDGDSTQTAQGIDYLINNFLPNARPQVTHIGIVITDGESSAREKTKASAATAREKGFQMFAIGVGGTPRFKAELEAIAGDSSRVLNPTDYASLNLIKEQLTSIVCLGIDEASENRHESNRT